MRHNKNFSNRLFPFSRTESILERRRTAIVIGGGILGLSTACKLIHKYKVTLVNNTSLDKTNSASALYGTVYVPSPHENKELYQLCKESYPCLAALTSIEGSGCTVIPIVQYFASKAKQDKAIATNESVKAGCTSIVDLNDKIYYQDKDFPYRIRVETIAIDFKIILKNFVNAFKKAGGIFKQEHINSLSSLKEKYDIVIVTAGWESAKLINDPLSFPDRGVIIKVNTNMLPNNLISKLPHYSFGVPPSMPGGDFRYFIRIGEICYLGTTLEPENGNNFTEEEKIKSAERVFKNLKGLIFEDALKALWLSEQKEISSGVRSRRKAMMPPMLKRIEGTNIIAAYGCGGSTYAAFPAVSEQIGRIANSIANEKRICDKKKVIRSKL